MASNIRDFEPRSEIGSSSHAGSSTEPSIPRRHFIPRKPLGRRSHAQPNLPSGPFSIPTNVNQNSLITSRPHSIRLRKLPSATGINTSFFEEQHHQAAVPSSSDRLAVPSASSSAAGHGRRRSASDPQRHSWANEPSLRGSQIMSPVQEIPGSPIPPTPPPKIPISLLDIPPTPPPKVPLEKVPTPPPKDPRRSRPGVPRIGSAFSIAGARSLLGMKQRVDDVNRMNPQPAPEPRREYDQDVVDLLDVIDPEVSTLSTLTNVQNSLFVPDLGRFINRRPTYDISSMVPRSRRGSKAGSSRRGSRAEPTPEPTPEATPLPTDEEEESYFPQTGDGLTQVPSLKRQASHAASITSALNESHYAVLPHGHTLDGWSQEDKDMLDDHVRHLLHSKKEKFKRGWRGFVAYVKRPMGLFITIYATLITLFGLAWVLFLIGWIYVGNKQLYVINIIDNVLVALFAIVGDGLAPFRAVDTYHMIFIAHYHHLTWKMRKKKNLPKLEDKNDLPTKETVHPTTGVTNKDLEEDDGRSAMIDLEANRNMKGEESVLTEEQQRKLEHHSNKFSKSHTFYKPHETVTHYAFPLRLLVAVVVLLDFHSIFQICLGACTWGIYYKRRPAALTATILCCSISCNIAAGITISIGDRMTRKKKIIEQQFRQQLTEEAIEEVQRKKLKQKEKVIEEDCAGEKRAEEEERSLRSESNESLSPSATHEKRYSANI